MDAYNYQVFSFINMITLISFLISFFFKDFKNPQVQGFFIIFFQIIWAKTEFLGEKKKSCFQPEHISVSISHSLVNITYLPGYQRYTLLNNVSQTFSSSIPVHLAGGVAPFEKTFHDIVKRCQKIHVLVRDGWGDGVYKNSKLFLSVILNFTDAAPWVHKPQFETVSLNFASETD